MTLTLTFDIDREGHMIITSHAKLHTHTKFQLSRTISNGDIDILIIYMLIRGNTKLGQRSRKLNRAL